MGVLGALCKLPYIKEPIHAIYYHARDCSSCIVDETEMHVQRVGLVSKEISDVLLTRQALLLSGSWWLPEHSPCLCQECRAACCRPQQLPQAWQLQAAASGLAQHGHAKRPARPCLRQLHTCNTRSYGFPIPRISCMQHPHTMCHQTSLVWSISGLVLHPTVLAWQTCQKPARQIKRFVLPEGRSKVRTTPSAFIKALGLSLLKGSPHSSSPHRGSRCIGMRHVRQVV